MDSNDRERVDDSLKELSDLVTLDEELVYTNILVFANKQDLPNAMKVEELKKEIENYLPQIKLRKWNIVGCCATSGKGLREGFEWLNNSFGEK